MKKLFILALACATCAGVSAQSIYYQDSANEDMLRHTDYQDVLRQEFIIPNVNGYKVLKSDLHAHTIFSDGSVTPEYRVLPPLQVRQRVTPLQRLLQRLHSATLLTK